jgi:hypothetical protein
LALRLSAGNAIGMVSLELATELQQRPGTANQAVPRSL